MKAVLISIHPRHCGNIASGKKTVEVRKTVPKMPTPFKCYIYCTSVKSLPLEEYVALHASTGGLCDKWSGKVIGEFVCDNIGQIRFDDDGDLLYEPCLAGSSPCLSLGELQSYIGVNNVGYGWHISDLKIYGKPKELGEFKKGCNDMDDPVFGSYCGYCEKGCFLTRPPQSWCYVEELEDDDEEAERIHADRLRDERRDEEALRQLESEE